MAPVVSVLIIAYNHEKYIAQAIESALMQKTNFDYEIVIGEDCSTDKTREIVLKYKGKYPDKIKLLLQEKNVGMMQNFIDTMKACSGKYISLLEGDDYWTDPYKLQKQVDFLEANPDFVICFHKIKILKNGRLIKDYITHVPSEVTTIKDLARYGNFIHTPSVMFRNGLLNEIPSWFYKSPIGDYPLYMLIAKYGKIKYIDKVMAVYRIHPNGIWSHRKKDDPFISKQLIEMKENMIEYFFELDEINEVLSENLTKSYLDLSDYYFRKGEINAAKELFIRASKQNINTVFEKYYKYKTYLYIFISLRNNLKHFFNRLFI